MLKKGLKELLHVRWLGRVRYRDAYSLQQGLFEHSPHDHLLLLEHDPVFTLGVRGDLAHLLTPPAEIGAELVRTDRGGDITYHGPGQLVGYPILTVPGKRGGGMGDTVAYVRSVEQLIIDSLTDLGLPSVGRMREYPGVWVDPDSDKPRKICAIGVKLTRARTMHGFALNVDPDMRFFEAIVPCGIKDYAVTSLRAEGIDASMKDVVDVVAARAIERWGADAAAEGHDGQEGHQGYVRQDVAWPGSAAARLGQLSGAARAEIPDAERPVALTSAASEGVSVRLRGRLAEAGVTDGLQIGTRKPSWLRAQARMGPDYLRLKRTMRELNLVTVCEDAGCPNIFECWSDGTATFMINGERCTRACGFCLVDTRHPEGEPDPAEPANVAEAVARMALDFAVITAVARDDLPDGGAAAFAESIRAIRRRRPGTSVEVLIPDCKGDPDSLDVIFAARPDVLNHNLETVARLQRAVRPSASYARSLAVLARAKAAGLTTKSGIILGLGETADEVVAALTDLRGIGIDIVTLGQYLRPTAHHMPVARWWTPDEFTELKAIGEAMGIPHVEASPLTRSSYHAKQAASASTSASVSA